MENDWMYHETKQQIIDGHANSQTMTNEYSQLAEPADLFDCIDHENIDML